MPSDDLVRRLEEIIQIDDHRRGCAGRTYECTCGYDMRVQEAMAEAKDALAASRARVAELTAPFERCDDEDWRRVLNGELLGYSAFGRFWRSVLADVRVALAPAAQADDATDEGEGR